MHKFLLALFFCGLSVIAAADDLPAIAALRAFRAPMEEIVRETGKGQAAEFAVVAKSFAEADKAWKPVVSEPLDLDRYGVPADRQEEAWRQVRMVGMLMSYLEEATRRGDRALMLRSAAMLKPAYDKLADIMGLH